jgi:hypothetical protein
MTVGLLLKEAALASGIVYTNYCFKEGVETLQLHEQTEILISEWKGEWFFYAPYLLEHVFIESTNWIS